jgi:hypothetical protein
MALYGNVNKNDFVRHVLNFGSLSGQTIEGIFHLGIYPEIFKLKPAGILANTQEYYQDVWGVKWSTADWQMEIQMQIGINLKEFNIPTMYLDTEKYKVLDFNNTGNFSTNGGLYNYMLYGDKASTLIEKSFTNSNTRAGGKFCNVPLGDSMGFQHFTPINEEIGYSGAYPYEKPLFRPVPPAWFIGGSSIGTDGAIDCYHYPDITNPLLGVSISLDQVWEPTNCVVPPLRKPFDVGFLGFYNSQPYFTYCRFFVDIVPIV